MSEVSDSAYWGMVWKTNRVKKENALLYELLEEVINHKGYMPKKTLKKKINFCKETLEREELIRMKKKVGLHPPCF